MPKSKQPIVNVRKQSKAVRRAKKKEKKEHTLLGQALRALGGAGGTALGTYFGAPTAGASLGTGLGAAVSRWLGAGAYTVNSNSVLTEAPSVPAMHSEGQSITVRHKEFIATIVGSSGFTVQREIVLNPGLRASFPWLSRLAGCYQQYRIRGLVFHYIPTSGNAVSSTNAALGSVMLQTTYRSTESAPSNKQELLNEYWSTETVPCDTVAHPIECDPKENPFQIHYVRQHGLTSTDEPLLYDMARTFVCTQGMQSTNAVGDLWMTYEVELYKPIVTSQVTGASYSAGIAQSATPAAPLTGFVFSQNGLEFPTPSNNVITFPRVTGVYVVLLYRGFTSGSFSAYGYPTYTATNCDMIIDTETNFVGTFLNGPADVLRVSVNDVSVTASVAITGLTATPATHFCVVNIFRTE